MNVFKPSTWFKSSKRAGEYAGPLRKVDRAQHDADWKAAGEFGLRRFDAAANNRLNSAHWLYAHGRSINVDLSDLPTLMARCSHEAANNPLVSGALDTLETDIVGRNGPRMQVVSEDDSFNETVEQAWREVWEMPDTNGRLGGAENLRLWVRMINTAGSFVNVYGTVERSGGMTSFGWRTIHPRRMVTPHRLAGSRNCAFGIEVTDEGRPIRYYIDSHPDANGFDYTPAIDPKAYTAEVVQHRFLSEEPEQITGFPALTPCLETIADLREYDKYVMEAAKNSAAHAVGLQATDPASVIDPDPMPAGAYHVEPGTVNVAPKGWSWSTLPSTQPSAQYRDFRHERLRELGLSLGMPLMMVLLSSADSNFASAHYDGAVYLRRIRSLQSWFERRTLNELLEQVIIELVLSGKVRRPKCYSFRWTWEIPPYVNPEKQRKADRMAVEDGAMPLDEYCAALGHDFDDVVAARQRINRTLEDAGLPLPPVNHGSAKQPPQEQESEGADASRFANA